MNFIIYILIEWYASCEDANSIPQKNSRQIGLQVINYKWF
ncbi:hypothetical protein GMMP1_60060 [Candidatus Magnetomoraceae bacterium gMMP-1]